MFLLHSRLGRACVFKVVFFHFPAALDSAISVAMETQDGCPPVSPASPAPDESPCEETVEEKDATWLDQERALRDQQTPHAKKSRTSAPQNSLNQGGTFLLAMCLREMTVLGKKKKHLLFWRRECLIIGISIEE